MKFLFIKKSSVFYILYPVSSVILFFFLFSSPAVFAGECDGGYCANSSCNNGDIQDSEDTSCPNEKPLCCKQKGSTGGSAITLEDPLGVGTVEGLIKKIVDWLLTIGGPIAVGFIIWGALQMVFAAGDPEKFKAGKQTILYAVIGYAIILIGWGITTIIESVLKGI